MSDTPFKIDLNLDDIEEMKQFLGDYEPQRGRVLANRLGFKGKHSVRAADALMGYAHNKRAAVLTRHQGRVGVAQHYEAICDQIYTEDIKPLITCW